MSRVPERTVPANQAGLRSGLFWRTFFLLALLLIGCIIAWLQTFRALEFEPRTLQSAQQNSYPHLFDFSFFLSVDPLMICPPSQ